MCVCVCVCVCACVCVCVCVVCVCVELKEELGVKWGKGHDDVYTFYNSVKDRLY